MVGAICYHSGIATDASETSQPGHASWIAVAVAVALVWLRLERAWLAEADLGPFQWIRWLGPELGLAALLGGGAALIPRRRTRTVVLIGASALILMGAVVAAQYFAHTGTPLNRSLVRYTLVHLGRLGGLLATGLDAGLLLRWLLVVAAVGTAVHMDRRCPPTWPSSPRHALALTVLGACVYVATLPRGSGYPGRHALALEPITGGSAAPMLVPNSSDSLYVAPEVTGSKLEAPPNILVIFMESTRRDVVVPYGPPEAASITPFLASMAGQAVVVESAYVTTSHTSKALVGALCGLYPRPRMDVTEPFHLPARCLPELVEAIGYRTAYFQSALGTFEDRTQLVTRMGFDRVASQENLAGPAFAPVGYIAMDELVMLQPVLDFASESPTPFLAAVLTSVPHHPYEAPGPAPPGAVEGSEIAYGAAIRHVDEFLRAVFAGLTQAGILEHTVVMILADHGEAFGEHQRRQHDAVPYEEVVAVPWLLFGRAFVGDPRSIRGLRSHLDLVPTVLDLVGAQWSGTLPGLSLFSSPGHNTVFTWCWLDDYCAAARTDDRKVVFHFDRQEIELFDLANDPGETSPLPLTDAQARMWNGRFRGLLGAVESMYARDAPPPPPQHPAPKPLTRPQCMRACVADVDANAPGLQYDCTVTEIDPDGTRAVLPHCVAGAESNESPCFHGRVDRELPHFCARRGFNLELGIRRSRPPHAGAVIDAGCRLSTDPERDCDPTRLVDQRLDSSVGHPAPP